MVSNPTQAKKFVRILKASFILAGFLYFYIVYKIPAKVDTLPNPSFQLIIAVIALSNIGLGFVLPGVIARNARRTQSNLLAKKSPIQRWISGCVLSLALFMSCILFGLVLHFVGAQSIVVESIFVAGLLAMLFWSPGTPPTEENAPS